LEANIQNKFKDNSINVSYVSLHISLNEKIGHRRMKMKNWLDTSFKTKDFSFQFCAITKWAKFPKIWQN